jgi:hypothetical protein
MAENEKLIESMINEWISKSGDEVDEDMSLEDKIEEYDNKDSTKQRKREIETLIEDYKKKIGDLTVEYHMLQSWVSPDGLD